MGSVENNQSLPTAAALTLDCRLGITTIVVMPSLQSNIL